MRRAEEEACQGAVCCKVKSRERRTVKVEFVDVTFQLLPLASKPLLSPCSHVRLPRGGTILILGADRDRCWDAVRREGEKERRREVMSVSFANSDSLSGSIYQSGFLPSELT